MNLRKKIRDRIDKIKYYGWQTLDLKNCGLSEFPSEIFNYTDLVTVDISNDSYCDEEYKNKIKVVPDDISKLKNLKRLNLSNNQLEFISENLSNLNKLSYLNLCNNNLTDISEKIANMSSLSEIYLEENPFDLLPPEIVARGISAIRNFYKELEEKDFLYEVKLLLVGQGRVGKTCLSQALIDENYILTDKQSTEGININRWIIPKEKIVEINPKIQRDFQMNIWDFGGQEIYHSTHQFFLTKRSIYLLVTESRKEDSHDDFFYWLNIIKLLGDSSPVIIVLNKCDQPSKELPIKEFKDSFSNVKDFHKISLKAGFQDKLEIFKTALTSIATNLPHIGNPLPKVWVDIRRELESLKLSGKNYISEAEYLEICKKHYRKEESALFLSGYFHDLGVLLHFQDDIELKDTVFLNHEWLTTGVYKILDDQKVIEQKGHFTLDDVKRIWSEEEYKNKIRELISLMKNRKFDLCFELPNGEYLVPRLLPVDEVEHSWISKPENTKFEFRYEFMPKGILTRLIVKMNSDIYNNKYWRYGVMLQSDGTEALIREKYFENKITIELAGNHKREYLFHIRKIINEIHKDYNKIKVSEMIPCNCSHCKTVVSPQFYPFELLQRYELNQIPEIRCEKSLETVKVSSLTSDILRKQLSSDRLIACENKNAEILKNLNLPNIIFFPERDSSTVFIKVKTKLDIYGLRDRDFLLDSEIQKIRSKYPNYFILNYYCFENYLYHPDNIQELGLASFNKEAYTNEIIKQKNEKKHHIISNFKNSRKNYQEFRIEHEKLQDKGNEDEIINNLLSDEIEVFFKSYSMKDYFSKKIIEKYQLKNIELASTNWFRSKIENLIR
ncbi:COR domain-containing protein [Catalinimonas niigatensis]|uniref:COR domain-containing protein n=1 Tax=Catalinimonas niigatensis TaxID=1397264 RepID=UPI00266690B9|nr:COR domain-containing protein [Catalinimonas niigatensis]WPP49857.1 COR domain-containing protein [Catalinimonas niigatensis]